MDKIRDDILNKIINKIARDAGISFDKAKQACLFQFKMVVDVIKEGKDDIKLPLLGKFFNYKTIDTYGVGRARSRDARRRNRPPSIQSGSEDDTGVQRFNR